MRSTVKYSFLFVNLACAAVLLLSSLAPFISPQNFWVFGLLGLSFPLLVLLNILWLFFWLIFKRSAALLSLVALLLSSLNIGKHFAFTSCFSSSAANGITAMTFNVKVFDLYNWSHNEESKNTLLNLIETTNPDILCLQEFYTDDSEQFNILKKLKAAYPHFHFQKTYTGKRNNHWGIATFSKYPLLRQDAIIFSNTKHNAAIASDLVVEGDTLRVFNAHLQSIHFGREEYEGMRGLEEGETSKLPFWKIFIKLKEAFFKRAVQADLLHREIVKSPYKVLVCADFNDTPNSYAYHRISKGMKDSFAEAGCGIGRTYSGPFPASRIDYILADEEITIQSHRVISNSVSDHFAVVASFVMN